MCRITDCRISHNQPVLSCNINIPLLQLIVLSVVYGHWYGGTCIKRFVLLVMLSFVFRLMIQEMVPASFLESDHFVAFIKCLNSSFQIPSRRTYMRNIKHKAEAGHAELVAMFSRVKHIATTADCWTSRNRSFLGMTAHWINEVTLKRERAVLACRELTMSHTHEVLADAMQKVHNAFEIDTKVIICKQFIKSYVIQCNSFKVAEIKIG